MLKQALQNFRATIILANIVLARLRRYGHPDCGGHLRGTKLAGSSSCRILTGIKVVYSQNEDHTAGQVPSPAETEKFIRCPSFLPLDRIFAILADFAALDSSVNQYLKTILRSEIA